METTVGQLINILKKEDKNRRVVAKLLTSKKWVIADVELGAVHTINKSDRRIFVIGFRQKAKYFKINDTALSFAEDGEKLIGTVVNKSDLQKKATFINKKGNVTYYKPLNKIKVKNKRNKICILK